MLLFRLMMRRKIQPILALTKCEQLLGGMKMRKLISLLLVVCVSLIPVLSFADDSIDLSGMSFSELVELQRRVTMAMWKTTEWQEVTVPTGLYQIGVEIPAGKWTITVLPQAYMETVEVGTNLDESGNAIAWRGKESQYLYGVDSWAYNESKTSSWTVNLADGMYISLSSTMVFTPYAGPSFTFK